MSPLAAYLIETLVTLLAVVSIGALILFGARRLGAGRSSGPMRLVGRLALDSRRSIYLVRIADRLIVVGASEAGLSSLCEMPSDKVEIPAELPPVSFSSVLEQLRQLKVPSSTSEKRDA